MPQECHPETDLKMLTVKPFILTKGDYSKSEIFLSAFLKLEKKIHNPCLINYRWNMVSTMPNHYIPTLTLSDGLMAVRNKWQETGEN